MKVTAIEDSIVQRVGKDIVSNFGAAFLLETMNRLYKEGNEELKCLTKEKEFDFSSGTAADDGYMDLPADWLWPVRLDATDHLQYRHPKVFSVKESHTYTFFQRRFYVANTSETTVVDSIYISQGLTLVEANPVADVSVDEPEWIPDLYHSYLIFAVAIDLGVDYPLMQKDIVNYERLRQALDRSHYLSDLASEPKEGPEARLSAIDPYD